MTIQSDIWIEQQCADPMPAWQKRIAWLKEEMPHVKSQPNIWRGYQDELEKLVWEIDRHKRQNWQPMIEPFERESIRTRTINAGTTDEQEQRILSYGLGSFGYDVRLEEEFRIFTNINSGIIDPHDFKDEHYHVVKGPHCIIPPNSFALSLTKEYIRVPRDVLVICLGKSTLARCGAIVNVTPLEPEWEGKVVIEISNTTTLPMKIYANEGIAQFLFLKGDQPCRLSYADRGGKYLGQQGVQDAKV